ncbi:unnamed protein product [Urochloa humidicola]
MAGVQARRGHRQATAAAPATSCCVHPLESAGPPCTFSTKQIWGSDMASAAFPPAHLPQENKLWRTR